MLNDAVIHYDTCYITQMFYFFARELKLGSNEQGIRVFAEFIYVGLKTEDHRLHSKTTLAEHCILIQRSPHGPKVLDGPNYLNGPNVVQIQSKLKLLCDLASCF